MMGWEVGECSYKSLRRGKRKDAILVYYLEELYNFVFNLKLKYFQDLTDASEDYSFLQHRLKLNNTVSSHFKLI